jgi:transposase
MQPVQAIVRVLLERGARRYDPAQSWSANVLALWDALWTFVTVEGVEPTNNAAERALRPAVLWRRRSFGCPSEAGCRFVERMLTTVQRLCLQERAVLDYLVQAISAHRQGSPAPELLTVC